MGTNKTRKEVTMQKVCVFCDKMETVPNSEHRAGVTYGYCSEACLQAKREKGEPYDPQKHMYHPTRVIVREA